MWLCQGGILGGSAGGCLQRFVARVSDQSHGASERGMMRSAQRSPKTCCNPPPTALSPRYSAALSPPSAPPTDGGENDTNTWRCPDQSADSPAGYWLRAPVCHCRPSKAEHHLLRACCDENKDRRGWRGRGRRGGDGGWYMALLLRKKSPLCAFSTGMEPCLDQCVTLCH